MAKLTLGRAVLGTLGLGLGLTTVTYALLYDANSEHRMAPMTLMVFLLGLVFVGVGLVLGGVYLVQRTFTTSAGPLSRVAASSLVLGLVTLAGLGLFHLWGGPVSPPLVLSAFVLVMLGVGLRVVDRVRQRS
jgi:hypothetical protein